MAEQYTEMFVNSDEVESGTIIPIHVLSVAGLAKWLSGQSQLTQNWVSQQQFTALPGTHLIVPDSEGQIAKVLLGKHSNVGVRLLQELPAVLPKADYQLSETTGMEAYLGWGLACYKFSRYTKKKTAWPRLFLPAEYQAEVLRLLSATNLVRDLVNTPTQDMGPAHLADQAEQLAESMRADFKVIIGEHLLDKNYPAIHAVGRAAADDRAPRLIHLSWGEPDQPLLALVGKGVCFDTGGLDIKPASGMLRMKKDMGGAAHALALAELVMSANLPVRLELLIPAVENSISADAYRPGDVINTRKGLSVEIGNTDAEGRLILADALTKAGEMEADLIIDFATLTGAARVALGPDLPPLFSNNKQVLESIHNCGDTVGDPLWPMPLYQPYAKALNSNIADLNNISSGLTGAGAVTAALFLQQFVTDSTDWVHIDTYAWNDKNYPGRPAGGEALGLRAVFSSLQLRYSGCK